VDTVSTYPSGDNFSGGDFVFRFNVLPTDAGGDGKVTLNPDVQNVVKRVGPSIGGGNYSPFSDIDGDGLISMNPEVQTLLASLGTSLPLGAPSGPGTVVAGAAPASVFRSTPTAPEPNAATAALERVIPVPLRIHSQTRDFDVMRFTLKRDATAPRALEGPGSLHLSAIVGRGLFDRSGLDSRDSVDLLDEVEPIL